MSLPAIAQARQNWLRVHDESDSPSARLEAWQAWAAMAASAGEPLDQLSHLSNDPVERFFSYTVDGPDGHVYWTGPGTFRANRHSHSYALPRHWWWTYLGKEPLRVGDSIRALCGEKNCIHPDHCAIQDRRARARQFTDAQLLGYMQVAALKVGHPPTRKEYDALQIGPSSTLFWVRFGSWSEGQRRAGVLDGTGAGITPAVPSQPPQGHANR
jgi:hypothetical protein